jgi:hypothetical protein
MEALSLDKNWPKALPLVVALSLPSKSTAVFSGDDVALPRSPTEQN